MNFKTLYLTVLCLFVPCYALAMSVTKQAAISNNFFIINNNIDSEYFITTSSLDPRLSGSNAWVKYGSKQVSLGYWGYVGWTANASYNVDMWIDNSPINEPFNGIRCKVSTNCPASGYISPMTTDNNGMYHVKPAAAGAAGGG